MKMTKNTKKTTTPKTVADLTQRLKWRLVKAPTLDDVALMVRENIISKEEAKEILFNVEEEDTEPSSEKVKALEEQIKFLEKVIDKVTQQNTVVWPTIVYRTHYPVNYWYTGGVMGGGGNYTLSSASNSASLSSGSGVIGSTSGTQTISIN